MSTAQRVFGGLLVGAGDGMVLAAQNRRKEALLRIQNEEVLKREKRRDDRADARADKTAKENRGLLTSVTNDKDGKMFGITRGGDVNELGITAPIKASDLPKSGLSVDDKRELDVAIDRHTSGKGSIEGETTDWKAVAKSLRAGGREDLAARIESGESTSNEVDVDSSEYREAQTQAEKWAEDQAKFFGRDKTDFADYGGNRSEAIQAKTLELYKQLKGGLTQPDATTTQTAPQGGGPVPGSGTESDPFVATTQDQVDWFRNSAPPGTIIMIDGKLYQK